MKGVLAAAVLGLCACAQVARGPAVPPPLEDEAELLVYLDPFPHEAGRLSFDLTGVAAVREGAEPVPLGLRRAAVAASDLVPGQRLLAAGRLPPGRYTALRLTIGAARLAAGPGASGPAALLVGPEPASVPLHADLRRGQAAVVVLSFDAERSVADGFTFTPRFGAAAPARPPSAALGACSGAAGQGLLLLDARTRAVGGLVATGRGPAGVALDPLAERAWVALGGQDQVEVVDLAAGHAAQRLNLRGGDAPRSVLLLPDRRTLFVTGFRSRAGAFLDTVSGQELARVELGDGPWSVALQRSGGRAYVANRRAGTLTVVDLAARQVVATVPTEPEPLQAQVNREGTRLWLLHAGSLNLVEYALPSLAVTRRLRIGLGAAALELDPRTGLLYVARDGRGRVEVYDPASALPVDAFDLPAAASQLAIDDVTGQLWAVLPSRRELAVVDLTSRRLLGVVELPWEPTELRLAAERE